MVTIGTQIPWESDGYGNRFCGSLTGMEQLSQAFHAEITRSSADADNALDAFSGQSRPCRISDGTLTHVRHMTNVVTLKLGSEVTQGH